MIIIPDIKNITHRCNELLEANKSIYPVSQIKKNAESRWCLYTLETDYDYDWTGMQFATYIKYCPFCGTLLGGDKD